MAQPFFLSNQQQQSQQFRPDLAQRASSAIDELFGVVGRPLGQVARPIAQTIAEPFVQPETAERFAAGVEQGVAALPRLAADAALAFGTKGRLKIPGKVAGFGDVALQGYANTEPEATTPQRLANAAIATGTFAAAPTVSRFSEAVAGSVARPVAQAALNTGFGPKTAAWIKTIGQKGGGYLGAVGALEAANAAGMAVQGQDYELSPEYIGANLVAGALLDLPGLVDVPNAHRKNVDLFRQLEEGRSSSEAVLQANKDSAAKAALVTRQREVTDTGSAELQAAARWNEDQLINGTSFGWKMREFMNTPEGQQPRSAEQIVGRLKNLYPDEWSMFEGMGIEQYLKTKGKVTGKDVDEWVERFAPRVEVRELFADKPVTPEMQEFAEIRHTLLDNLDDFQHTAVRQYLDGQYVIEDLRATRRFNDTQLTQIERLKELQKYDLSTKDNESATARYTMVNPKPLDQMPGAVDLLVRIPPSITQATFDEVQARNERGFENQTEKDDFYNQVKYRSNHYPTEGKNLLAHVRGYFETLPAGHPQAGKKVFHVFETQSDWAQQVREEGQYKDSDDVHSPYHPSNKTPTDPLLRHYERLAIKTAIDHAIKNGADYIAVSDAETAMITEGHDKLVGEMNPLANFPTRAEAEKYVNEVGGNSRIVEKRGLFQVISDEPVQAKGMRLHYDRTLPKIAEELTGDKGKLVDFGEHQNAVDQNAEREARSWVPALTEEEVRAEVNKNKYRKDLIFRNPDGTPKTTSTARLYPLDRAKQLIASRGGIPLLSPKLTSGQPASDLTRPLHARDVELLSQLEQGGLLPDELSLVAQSLDAQRREPTVSLSQHIIKQLFGERGTVLEEAATPDQLLNDARAYLQYVTKTLYKFDDAKADWWTKRVLAYVARVGHAQGETRVLPAATWTEGDWLKSASFYAPSRSNLPNAFIGVIAQPGVGADQAMFTIMHSIGHELFHGALQQAQGKSFAAKLPPEYVKHAMALVKAADELKLTQQEMEQSIDHLLQTVGGKKGSFGYRSKYYTPDPAGRQEYLADMFGLVAMSQGTGRESKVSRAINEAVKFFPDPMRRFLQGVASEVSKVWTSALDYTKNVLRYRTETTQIIEGLVRNMQGMVKSIEWSDRAAEAFMRHVELKEARPWAPIEGLSYDKVQKLYAVLGLEGYDKETLPMVQAMAKMAVPNAEHNALPKQLKWTDYFKAMPQLVRDYAEFADMAKLGRDYPSLTKSAALAMADSLKDPLTNKYDIPTIKRLMNPKDQMAVAFNRIGLLQQEKEKVLTVEDKNKLPEYQRLSPEDRRALDIKLSQVSAMVVQGAHRYVGSFKNDVGMTLAIPFMSYDRTMAWDKAAQLGQAMADLHLDTDRLVGDRESDPALWASYEDAVKIRDEYVNADPLNLANWTLIERTFTHDVNGNPHQGRSPIVERFNAFRGRLLGEWDMVDVHNPMGRYQFKTKPWYMPEVRTGRYLLIYREKAPSGGDGELVVNDYKDEKEWHQDILKVRERKTKGEVTYVKEINKSDNQDLYTGLHPDAGAALADAVKQLNASVLTKIKREGDGQWDEIVAELQKELNPDPLLAELIKTPYLKERALVKGRERLNLMEGMVHYINATSYTIGKKHAKGQQRLYLKDPKMRANPGLAKIARKYFSEIVDPTEKGMGWLKSLVALNYIYFSPSLALIETTQQIVNHVPALISQGVPIGQAYRLLKDMNVTVGKAIADGMRRKLPRHYTEPELQRVYERAVNDGTVDEGHLRELLHNEDDLEFLNSRSLLTGDGVVSKVRDLVASPLYWFHKTGRHFHSLAIRYNQEVAILSSYKWFRSKGLSEEAAYNEARELTYESMHGGGRASRPLWFLGIGPGQQNQYTAGAQVGGLMFLLQTYTFNTIAAQIRYLRRGISTDGRLSQSEKQAALAAVGVMTLTQVLLAGVQGIPFSTQVIALIEQLFEESQPKRRIREALDVGTTSFLGEGPMADLVADAAWGGLANAIGPWDVAGRFQLGGLLGVDPYKGFSWEMALGPVAGILGDAFRGIQQDQYSNLIPNTNIKRLTQLMSNGWDARNRDDRLNVDLTATEAGLLSLGFQPKRVSQLREYDQMLKRAELVQSRQQRRFHSELADLMLQGRQQEVTLLLQQRATDSGGTYDPREGARAVAEMVQSRTIPHDPGRQGSLQGDSYEVNRLFDRPQGLPTEAERLQGMGELMNMMGMYRPPTRSEVKSAMMIDYLLQTNPWMSRQEAKVLLERQMGQRMR